MAPALVRSPGVLAGRVRTTRRPIPAIPARLAVTTLGLCGVLLAGLSAPRAQSPDQPPPAANLAARGAFGREVRALHDARRFAGIRQGVVHLAEASNTSPPVPIGELGTNNSCLLFSTDGEVLFAGGWGGEVQVSSLAQQKPLHRLRGSGSPLRHLLQDTGGSMLAALQWDEPLPTPLSAQAQAAVAEMAEGHNSGLGFQTEPPARVAIWRVGNWRELKSWAIPGGVSACKLSPDGRFLATSHGHGSIYLWDLNDRCRSNLVSCPSAISAISFSPDGHWLAAAISLAGSVRVWEMPGLKWHADLSLPDMASDLSFSPDSKRLATANAGANGVSLWDVATWQPLITLERPQEVQRTPTFTSNGNQLHSINDKGEVLSWNAPSFAEIAKRERRKLPARYRE